MDPLSIAGPTITFVQVSENLIREIRQIKSATPELLHLTTRLQLCRTVVETLIKLLQRQNGPAMAEDLDSVLGETSTRIQEFNSSLMKASGGQNRIPSWRVQQITEGCSYLDADLTRLLSVLPVVLQSTMVSSLPQVSHNCLTGSHSCLVGSHAGLSGSHNCLAGSHAGLAGLHDRLARTHATSEIRVSIKHSHGGEQDVQWAPLAIPDDLPGTSFDDYRKTLSMRDQRFLKRLNFEPRLANVAVWPVRKIKTNAKTKANEHHINRLNVHEWLTSLQSRGDAQHHNPPKSKDGIRDHNINHVATLIYCDHGSQTAPVNTVPMSESIYAQIMSRCDISPGFAVELIRGTPLFRAVSLNPDSDNLKFLLRLPVALNSNWTLAVSWIHSSEHTKPSLYYFLHGATRFEIETLFGALEDVKELAAHPLTLPLILCELAVESDARELRRHANNLYSVELRTNYLRLDDFTGNDCQAEDNLEDLTRRVNGIISRLAFLEMRLESCARLVGEISCHSQVLAEKNAKKWNIDAWRQPELMLTEKVGFLESDHRALAIEIACNQKIASGQLQILYNLIAQRDNRNNLQMTTISTDIARNTKEDSFAMRTIAIMTISFLPATAVSSLFSMTMFNWNNAGTNQPVVSKFFWIYWVVAGLLTASVLGLWFLWMRMHQRNEKGGRPDRSELDPMSVGTEHEPKSGTCQKPEMEPSHSFGASEDRDRHSISRKRDRQKAPDPEKAVLDSVNNILDQSRQPTTVGSTTAVPDPPGETETPKRADTFVQGPLR